MIYSIKEELNVMFLLVVYGVYLSFYYDLVDIIIKNLSKKIIKIILEIILSVIQIYISYLYIFKIEEGYIPLYFFAFIIVGVLFYFIFKKSTNKVLNNIIRIVLIQLDKAFKEIVLFIYPKYIKEILQNFKRRRKNRKKKDIEIWKG